MSSIDVLTSLRDHAAADDARFDRLDKRAADIEDQQHLLHVELVKLRTEITSSIKTGAWILGGLFALAQFVLTKL